MSAAPVLEPLPSNPRRALGAVSAGRSARRERAVQGVGPAEVSARTVLVAESDPKLRALLCVGLTRAGFEVIPVADASAFEKALYFGGTAIDLVVLEAKLGAADGLSLCARLRAEQATAHLPVVLLTESATRDVLLAAAAAGADEWLAKPAFVKDVVSLAKLRAGGECTDRSFETSAETLPPAELLRALLAAGRSGRIELTDGVLDFCAGRVVRSTFRGEEGLLALRRLLVFARGRYQVRFGPVTEKGAPVTLREVCRSAIPAWRRWEKVVRSAVPMEAVLTADLPKLLELRRDLPVEAEGLVRIFDGVRTVEQALLATSLDEPTALAAATRLYELGVLMPARPKTRPVDPMLDGLPEDARRQLEAFRIRTVQEVKRPSLRIVTQPPAPEPAAKTQTSAAPVAKAQTGAEVVAPVKKMRTVTPTALAHPGEPLAMPVAISAALTEEDRAALARALPPTWQRAVGALLLGAALIGAAAALVLRKPSAPVPTASALSTPATDAQAIDAYRQGDRAKAGALVAELISSRPLDAKAWTLLAQLRLDAGDLDGAREAVQRALAIRPGADDALAVAQRLGLATEGTAAASR